MVLENSISNNYQRYFEIELLDIPFMLDILPTTYSSCNFYLKTSSYVYFT